MAPQRQRALELDSVGHTVFLFTRGPIVIVVLVGRANWYLPPPVPPKGCAPIERRRTMLTLFHSRCDEEMYVFMLLGGIFSVTVRGTPSFCLYLYFMFGNIYIARADNQMPVGVRPLGMGSSFTAVSDDANAIAWNPAGLVNVRQQAISGMTTNLHGIESLQQNYLSYIIPITDRHAVGFDWMQLRFGDDELRYSDDRVSLSYGVGLTRSLSAGLNIKRVSVGSELDTYPSFHLAKDR